MPSELRGQRNHTETADDVGELIEQWTKDPSDEGDRQLSVIRSAHMMMFPAVLTGLGIFFRDRPTTLITLAAAYAAGLIVVWRLIPERRQMSILGLFDTAIIGAVASTHPVVFMAMVLPMAATVSIGWLISTRSTVVLTTSASISMGAAAYFARPTGALIIVLIFCMTMMAMNRTNLRMYSAARRNVLRVTDLVESLPVIVWESDVSTGVLTRAVGRVEELLGYSAHDWVGMPVEKRVHTDDLTARADALLEASRSPEPVVYDYRLRCSDGSILPVREVARSVEVGGRRYIRGVVLDVTEERAARSAVDRLAAVVDSQREPLVVVAARDRATDPVIVLQANPAFAKLVNAEADDLHDLAVSNIAPWLPRLLFEDLDELRQGRMVTPRRDIDIAMPEADVVFDIEYVVLTDAAVAIQFIDVTDRKIATELIRHQAFHDLLTGLPNRSLLFDRLGQALQRAEREGSSVGLLLMDLDLFKEINDTLGHAYGDELLAIIGERLTTMTRGADTVARLGGDEFAMVISGATEGELADVAERALTLVKNPVVLGGIEVEVSASVGGVIAPHHGNDEHVLLQRADIAMYEAKRSGTSFRLYTPTDDRHSVDRLTLMGELKGLLTGELRVWYQPKVDLRTRRAVGVEALARWEHPRMGLLGPDQFIELCEVSGLVGDLTWRVLDVSLAAAASWNDRVEVAVNVPARNLYDRHLAASIVAMLKRHGVAPERLVMEITEREIMEDHRTVVDVLSDVHESGVRISIDDFGTGFSSLAHLRRLPISEIKIDRSFIAGMLERENDYIIARSIIDLAHNLGHSVVAEGVEDDRVLDLLTELGCDVGQGYLFAKPAPRDEVSEWLSHSATGRIAGNDRQSRTVVDS